MKTLVEMVALEVDHEFCGIMAYKRGTSKATFNI
jgi:hypothetical protein